MRKDELYPDLLIEEGKRELKDALAGMSEEDVVEVLQGVRRLRPLLQLLTASEIEQLLPVNEGEKTPS